MSLFVRVMTHYGSNDSLEVFSEGLKYMIIKLDIKIIIIKQKMLEPFQITQSKLMGQYFGIHWITTLESQIR